VGRAVGRFAAAAAAWTNSQEWRSSFPQKSAEKTAARVYSPYADQLVLAWLRILHTSATDPISSVIPRPMQKP
jgi:hypothetical protein